MGRSFHNLHVFADSARTKASVIKAVLAHAKADGYERVARVSAADRVIRIGGASPWLTIEDDGSGIDGIAKAVARTRAPLLEAYCEASAIVWLELYANARKAGGWGNGKRPPARLVEPLLAKGTPSDLAKAWDEGQRQVFPETALAVAAQHFGIKVDRMFGDSVLRGTTIALRRRRAAWTPKYQVGTPKFCVGWGSNGGWGARHLVFEEEVEDHRVHVESIGGPGRGLSIRFSGSALENRHIEILSVEHEGLKLVRDGASPTWRDPDAKVPAGLVDKPDVFSPGRREADKAREIEGKSEWYIDVKYRGVAEGACELGALVESGRGRGKDALDLQIMWRPWRPATAREHTDDHRLFDMHRCEHVQAHITLRAPLAAAWRWARSHVERWCAAEGDNFLHVMRGDDEVVLRESLHERDALSYTAVGELVPDARDVPFQAAGQKFLFGTFRFKPWRFYASDQLVVQLVLGGASHDEDNAAQFARLTAICDDAMEQGIAYSAVVAAHHHVPGEKTAWEDITATDDHPLKTVSWHARHLRGIDKRMWLSAEHVALVDRAALARHATITPVGAGIRLNVPDDQPRRTLAPLEQLLLELLPHARTIDAWKAEREGNG